MSYVPTETRLLVEIEECKEIIDQRMAEVRKLTHPGQSYEGLDPVELKDAYGRSLMADLVAVKAQLIQSEVMLLKG